MVWFYVTLIVSIAANIGFTIYICFNHQLDKWEKRNDQSTTLANLNKYQYRADVHSTPREPTDKGEAIVKTDIRPQSREG